MNVSRREILKYLTMAPFAGLAAPVVAAPVVESATIASFHHPGVSNGTCLMSAEAARRVVNAVRKAHGMGPARRRYVVPTYTTIQVEIQDTPS